MQAGRIPGTNRRDFVKVSSSAAGGIAFGGWMGRDLLAQDGGLPAPPALKIAPFRFDVTPPLGHSLCGGWIPPALEIVDSLEAIGFVLLGCGDPIVVCSVDWTGLLNDAHLAWRTAFAEAANTDPQRVAVHCVHQHDAPFVCLETQRIIAQQQDLPSIIDLDFFESCLESGKAAIRTALETPVEITSVGHSEAIVDRVASNRRIVDLSGHVVSQRGSSSKEPDHQRLPEGLIDPYLKTIAFYSHNQLVLACHYYACHPMSFYGKGGVSSDFCGLARKQLQLQYPDCTHIYFNGCGGNIGAGKYNDGSLEARQLLTQRILDGMRSSLSGLSPQPIQSCNWVTEDILPPPREELNSEEILAQVSDRMRTVVDRNRPAFILSYLNRYRCGMPITLAGLNVNDISILHLPSECYIEYQLRAQATNRDRFIACAAYGDGGPWYIPTKEAYPQGGYSVGVAWCDPQIDEIISQAMMRLLESA